MLPGKPVLAQVRVTVPLVAPDMGAGVTVTEICATAYDACAKTSANVIPSLFIIGFGFFEDM
jgi:hypothetical protein